MQVDMDKNYNNVNMTAQKQQLTEEAGGLRLAPTSANHAKRNEHIAMGLDHLKAYKQKKFAMQALPPRKGAAMLRRDLPTDPAVVTSMNEKRIHPEDAIIIDPYAMGDE